MSGNILLTGATGFLGTQIALRLLEQTPYKIIALVRGDDDKAALRHISRAWWEWPELTGTIGDRVQVVRGDVTEQLLGLEKKVYDQLLCNVTHIIHTVADLRLNASIEDLRRTNVQGTVNVLKLADLAHKDHEISRFSYISTAYVAGRKMGPVSEDSLSHEDGFLNNYERSKFEGEIQVKNSSLPVSIFRPGMVVGDSKTGAIKTFNTVYVPIRLYLTEKMRIIPVKPSIRINLVPVDYVADAVVRLTFDSNAKGLTFHLTAPYDYLPTVEELVKYVRHWASEKLDVNLPYPRFIPFSPSIFSKISYLQRLMGQKRRRLINTLITLAPYLGEKRHFNRENTDRLLGPYELKWQDFLPSLLKYAVYMGFFHRSERTVHEQILFRLKSRSRPVEYYDIAGGEFIKRSSVELRQEMIYAARSLHKLNVKPGERIALLGFNSTRYLSVDVAIGLLGATSVPIYYTSPVNEINEILKDSGAKVLFVGISKLLNISNKIKTKITVVSFCRESMDLPSDVMSWEEFLAQGKETDKQELKNHKLKNQKIETQETQENAPVTFNDIATIRYTSGTTGKPRGVMFAHGNLRWMAESLASLPPWKDRNSEVTYLSFLPMNHVVEGILGTYSPYYAPAPLKLYFLEDFQYLQQTLPRVRPKIFFSVPRFYEKVWAGLIETRMGKIYINSNKGFKKNILKKILRRELLKKTGLNRCAQLIVGSASVSNDLLQAYRDLGIEVHNAYGLTEAPLVTINRLGENRIGTVGKPLPSTHICIAQDGEIMVKGPQVTSGYFNTDTDSLFRNGWLFTGDYGHLTFEEDLVIDGRKKEIIINSYGKSINPLKIEAMLRNIPGISEAMLIGEGKPYCSAILWVKDEVDSSGIHENIENLNSRLSRPEQIKRWAIINEEISIEGGELTANLKIKRKPIIQRYKNVIDSLYENGNINGSQQKVLIHGDGLVDNNES